MRHQGCNVIASTIIGLVDNMDHISIRVACGPIVIDPHEPIDMSSQTFVGDVHNPIVLSQDDQSPQKANGKKVASLLYESLAKIAGLPCGIPQAH